MKKSNLLSLTFAKITITFYIIFFIIDTIIILSGHDFTASKIFGLFGLLLVTCLVLNIVGIILFLTKERKLMTRLFDKIFTLVVNLIFPILLIVGMIIFII